MSYLPKTLKNIYLCDHETPNKEKFEIEVTVYSDFVEGSYFWISHKHIVH